MTLPITDLKVIMGDNASILPPPGYVKVPVDLNKGSGGLFIYLCYQRSDKPPITGLTVLLGSNTAPPSGYTKLTEDLNKSVGGEYISGLQERWWKSDYRYHLSSYWKQ